MSCLGQRVSQALEIYEVRVFPLRHRDKRLTPAAA